MGSKTSCQGLNCSQESIGICKCSDQRFCRSCYEKHCQDLASTVHTFVTSSGSPLNNENELITMKSITFTKLIYRSPEGSTEVHEGLVKSRPGKYAIKIMHCMNEADLAKKQKESEMQQNMKHPSICECVASFRDETYKTGCRFVIVLEFSEEGDIEQDIEKRKLKKNPWTEAELMTHFKELIDAFGYMQDNNLTHGDVKPRNLYLSAGGKIKIGDFGESKQRMQALVTQTYQVTGTVIYFSPLLFEAYLNIIKGKNLKGDVRHNPIKSDVYSLGLSFLHMASLNKPSELNNLEIGVDVLQTNIDRTVSKLNYSDNLKQLILKMLQVQESKRHDFKQLRNFLNPAERRVSTEETQKSKQQLSKSIYPLLVSISQVQGVAIVLDSKYKISKLNSHRFQSSSRAVIIGDSVIITGGLKNIKNVYKINVVTCAATKLQDMGKGHAFHTMLIHDSYLFVIGGRDEEKKSLTESEKLRINEEMSDSHWQSCGNLNLPRENATSISVLNSIFIFGGQYKNGTKLVLTDVIERYKEGVWQLMDVKMFRPASAVGLCFDNESIWLVGGNLERGQISKKVYKFLVKTDGIEREECKEELEDADYFTSGAAYVDSSGNFILLGNHIDGYHSYDKNSAKWVSDKDKDR